jgi:hypothetical protein
MSISLSKALLTRGVIAQCSYSVKTRMDTEVAFDGVDNHGREGNEGDRSRSRSTRVADGTVMSVADPGADSPTDSLAAQVPSSLGWRLIVAGTARKFQSSTSRAHANVELIGMKFTDNALEGWADSGFYEARNASGDNCALPCGPTP